MRDANHPLPVIREVTRGELEPATLDQLTDLHLGAFPRGITTRLGRRFVRRYYQAATETPAVHLWVAELDGRVVGFLCGTVDRDGFERTNRAGAAHAPALWRLVTLRLTPLAVLRTIRKRWHSRKVADCAELISIAVSPDLRRSGIGGRFLTLWRDKLIENNIHSYIVYTDNPEGIRFYEKSGGEPIFKFRLGKMTSAAYRVHLAP